MLHWSVPQPEAVPDDIIQAAREAAAAVAHPHLRWQYVEGHCDHFSIVQACVHAIKVERQKHRPQRGLMSDADPIGWIERG